jgi:hypothetical protein
MRLVISGIDTSMELNDIYFHKLGSVVTDIYVSLDDNIIMFFFIIISFISGITLRHISIHDILAFVTIYTNSHHLQAFSINNIHESI